MENKPKRPGGPGGHGGPMGHGMVLGGAKAKDFKGSMKRLLNYLKPMFPDSSLFLSLLVLVPYLLLQALKSLVVLPILLWKVLLELQVVLVV